MNTDTDTKTDIEEPKKESNYQIQKRLREEKRRLEAKRDELQSLVFQRIWNDCAEIQDTPANGMVLTTTAKTVSRYILGGVYICEKLFRTRYSNPGYTCFKWLRNKEVWTGVFRSKYDADTGEWKIIPETYNILDFIKLNDYDKWMEYAESFLKELKQCSKHNFAMKYIEQLVKEEAQKLEIQNT